MPRAPLPRPRRRTARGRVRAVVLAALPCVAAAAGTSPRLDHTHAGSCAAVQRRLIDTPLPVVNVIETDFEAFKRSKPSVRPLRSHQFLRRDAAGRPVELSCKTKTADHLRSVYGTAGAGTADRACRHLHREMVNGVWRSLTAAQRDGAAFPPTRVLLEPDALSLTGSSWVRSQAAAWRGADGRLHLRSAALFAEWEDWRWKVMPESWRGNHYCHLVAPERLRRLMLGEEPPAGTDPG
jgi:hypothetical protein